MFSCTTSCSEDGEKAAASAAVHDETHPSQMFFSEEGTYDNPAGAIHSNRDDFVTCDTLPGTHYDMSAPLTGPRDVEVSDGGPRSPRAVASEQMNDDVRHMNSTNTPTLSH